MLSLMKMAEEELAWSRYLLTQAPWESGDKGVKSGVARSGPEIFILQSHLVDVTGKEMLSGEEEAQYGEGRVCGRGQQDLACTAGNMEGLRMSLS